MERGREEKGGRRQLERKERGMGKKKITQVGPLESHGWAQLALREATDVTSTFSLAQDWSWLRDKQDLDSSHFVFLS